MKLFAGIMKLLAALAAVAGIVYVIATYGDKIVAWAKKLLNIECCCDDCEGCCCDGECDCEDCDCADDCECCKECECCEEAAEEATEEADFEEEAE